MMPENPVTRKEIHKHRREHIAALILSGIDIEKGTAMPIKTTVAYALDIADELIQQVDAS